MKMLNKDIVQKITIVILSALLVVTWCGLLAVVFNPDSIANPPLYGPGSSSRSPYLGNYKIDANTTLKSIDNGQPLIFLPETAQISNSNLNHKLHWTQSEYLKVVFALFEFEWKETLDHNWTINSMIFERECEDNPAGFERAAFLFDQLIYQKEFRYNTRAIEISLPDSTASWGSGGGYPRPLLGATEFNLDDLKITADDAFKLAEENGGKEARQSIQNNCKISLHLGENWRVRYAGPLDRAKTLFDIFIDPYTGKIISSR